ncbi:PAS domain S-box protein [Halosegnis marinus]|uniref:PAS domain S-box protein n=1 Tax=Halosegnis marinus TaxID=3034023 RepID=UPI003612831E
MRTSSSTTRRSRSSSSASPRTGFAGRAADAGAADWFARDDPRLDVLASRLSDAVEGRRAARSDAPDRPTESAMLDAVGGGPYAVLVTDPTETIHYAGGGVEELLGYAPEELVGERVDTIVPEAFADDHHEAMSRYLAGGSRHLDWNGVGLVVQHRDGSTVPVEVMLGDVEADEGHLLAAVIRERTGSTDANERFRKHRAFSASVFENVDDGVLVADRDGAVLDANPAASDTLGYDYTDLAGRAVSDLLADDGAELSPPFEPGGQVTTTMRTADGEEIVVEASLTDIEYDGEDAVLITGRDVTERVAREAELERQNERLEEFVSIVSHDLRNPLNAASMNADLVAEGHDRIDVVREALDDMATLIDDLLELARSGRVIEDPSPFSLAAVAGNAWDTIETDAPVTVETDGDAEFRGDAGRVEQALGNLFRNSIEHGYDGESELTVRVGALDDESGFYVEDDGVGIPEDERGAVFDYGVTTEEGGTGYGLAIVSDIVEAHEWTVTATASDAGGARFEVRTESTPGTE